MAAVGMRPSQNIFAMASSPAKAPGWPIAVAPIIRHQPADASMYARASMISIWVTGSASAPPRDIGSLSVKRPASRIASTVEGASVPSRSDSSAEEATVSLTASTKSSRSRRFWLRSLGNVGRFKLMSYWDSADEVRLAPMVRSVYFTFLIQARLSILHTALREPRSDGKRLSMSTSSAPCHRLTTSTTSQLHAPSATMTTEPLKDIAASTLIP